MIQLSNVAQFLDEFFLVRQHTEGAGGVLRDSARPVRRLGLALEAWPGLAVWADENDLDVVFLHRARTLSTEVLRDDIGVLSYHQPFDERLALGFNPRLAEALGMSSIGVLGKKEGRPIGMIGTVREQHVAEYFRQVRDVFGGYDESHTCEQDCVKRVAVVGAMNKSLVHQASERGADVFITGEYRQAGRVGVLETGIGVVIAGHERSEQWGLRALAGVLRERWAGLDVVLAPQHQIK